MVDRYSPRDYSEDGSTIFVDGKEEISLRIQIDATDVLAVGEGQGIARIPARSAGGSEEKRESLYRVKLKTETRFPTGDNRESPSGVKTRLPLL